MARPASERKLIARPEFPSTISQKFYLKGNATGIKKIDGVFLGTRPKANTYTGFSLPYGQVTQIFGYDNKSAFVYAGTNGAGQPLLLGGFPQSDGTLAIKPALAGETGQQPIECTIVAKTLLCGVILNGQNYNKLVISDYNNDGNYELSMSAVFATAVQLVVEKTET